MNTRRFYPAIVLLLLFSAPIFADSHLPIGLQKIEEHQRQQAQYYLQNISFLVAFIGGILSFLLPCTLAILPAFFAYTFREKKNITKMTSIFFLGFSLVFILFGILAAALGKSVTHPGSVLEVTRISPSRDEISFGFRIIFTFPRTLPGQQPIPFRSPSIFSILLELKKSLAW